jgi:hypothetical protein
MPVVAAQAALFLMTLREWRWCLRELSRSWDSQSMLSGYLSAIGLQIGRPWLGICQIVQLVETRRGCLRRNVGWLRSRSLDEEGREVRGGACPVQMFKCVVLPRCEIVRSQRQRE